MIKNKSIFLKGGTILYKQGQLKTSVFARLCGVSVKTVQRWDYDNLVPSHRTDTDRRYYTMEDVRLVEELRLIPKERHIR